MGILRVGGKFWKFWVIEDPQNSVLEFSGRENQADGEKFLENWWWFLGGRRIYFLVRSLQISAEKW